MIWDDLLSQDMIQNDLCIIMHNSTSNIKTTIMFDLLMMRLFKNKTKYSYQNRLIIIHHKMKVFFTYSIARRRRRLSGQHMYMFSRHRKLDFCKIISFISGLKCLQKLR